jgi:hypothetical protein
MSVKADLLVCFMASLGKKRWIARRRSDPTRIIADFPYRVN